MQTKQAFRDEQSASARCSQIRQTSRAVVAAGPNHRNGSDWATMGRVVPPRPVL